MSTVELARRLLRRPDSRSASVMAGTPADRRRACATGDAIARAETHPSFRHGRRSPTMTVGRTIPTESDSPALRVPRRLAAPGGPAGARCRPLRLGLSERSAPRTFPAMMQAWPVIVSAMLNAPAQILAPLHAGPRPDARVRFRRRIARSAWVWLRRSGGSRIVSTTIGVDRRHDHALAVMQPLEIGRKIRRVRGRARARRRHGAPRDTARSRCSPTCAPRRRRASARGRSD